MIDRIKAMLAMHESGMALHEAGAAMCRSLLSEFDAVICPHDNCGIVADSTMGKDADGNWNQKYICLDCQQEVTEDEYLCSQE